MNENPYLLTNPSSAYTTNIKVEHVSRESQPSLTSSPSRGYSLLGGLQNAVLAMATLTSPHIHLSDVPNLSASISSHVQFYVPRSGRRISFQEAHKLALQILADAERNTERARKAEAEFLAMGWETNTTEV